jgi:hypothetical protein
MELNEGFQKEIQALRAENSLLLQENGRLRGKISELETTMAARIAECVTKAVEQATAPLLEELKKAHTEIARRTMPPEAVICFVI